MYRMTERCFAFFSTFRYECSGLVMKKRGERMRRGEEGREGEERRREKEREGVVGSGSCDCFGFDLGSIYRVHARMRPPTRHIVSNATDPMNVHTEATSGCAHRLEFTLTYVRRARTHVHRPIDVAMNLRENLTLFASPAIPRASHGPTDRLT